MKRGKELTWKKSFLIACVCQQLLVMQWYFGSQHSSYGRHEPIVQISLMYFVVLLLAALIWQSWKVFLLAVAIPVTLIVGKTLYYLIRL